MDEEGEKETGGAMDLKAEIWESVVKPRINLSIKARAASGRVTVP